ncbi:MAG: DUF4111 domain-containing protein [Lachnospiraceae bacterium]|nr:DUF4111 domain-containing protein [Lachnospiraceae bacterium]
MREDDLLEKIKAAYQNILQQKLVGIYVHGSLAFGCFQWSKSDIDFLVVVKEALSLEEKEALIRVLLKLDEYAPQKGFEMSVVLESVCQPFRYPTPYELHFSNFHKENFKADLTGYCQKLNGTDKDLAAHFTVTQKVGTVLCGKAIPEVFGEVPKEAYLDSLKEDIADAKESIAENPVYYVLNLCRVLAYVKDDVVLSKKQGGEWGIENLPSELVSVVRGALREYSENVAFEAEEKVLLKFANDMLEWIFV